MESAGKLLNHLELVLMLLVTGQDRTGQDRAGQGRTGQDRTRHYSYVFVRSAPTSLASDHAAFITFTMRTDDFKLN